MATETGATTTTTLTEWIRSEQFGPSVLIENADVPVHEMIADMRDASQGNSATFVWPREKEADETALNFTFASGKTQLDTAGYGNAISMDSDRATAAAVVLGIKRSVADEAIQDASMFFDLNRVVANSIRVMRRRMSLDSLLRIQSVSANTTSYSGSAFNRERFGAVKSALLAQDAEGTFGCVMGNGHVRELESDARSTGATQIFHDSPIFPNVQGMKGMHEGVICIESGLVPAEDADNDNGAMFIMERDRTPFGLASWWLPGNPVETFAVGAGGILSFFVDIFKVEIDRDPDDDGYRIWVKSRVAHALTYEGNIHEFIAID